MTFDFNKELNKLGLRKYEAEAEDREPIDFSISNEEDNKCWVYGSEPWRDYHVECDHPDEAIEWGDDDECGECLLCGAQCSWRWVEEDEYEGTDEYGDIVSSKSGYREIGEWHDTGNKGLVGKYLEQLRENF